MIVSDLGSMAVGLVTPRRRGPKPRRARIKDDTERWGKDGVKRSKLNLRSRRPSGKHFQRFPPSLFPFSPVSSVSRSPFFFSPPFDLAAAQSHDADGVYIFYSPFHMREHVLKRRKRNLLQINEALSVKAAKAAKAAMAGAVPAPAIAGGIGNSI